MNYISLITDFFMWLLIINILMQLFIFAFLYFAFDFGYMFWKKIYMGSKEDFNQLLVKILLQYRILTVFFVLIPYLSLLIISPN